MSNQPISDRDQPDPWLLPSPIQPGLFYLTFTLGNRIEIWSSRSLESFHSHSAEKATIYQPRHNVDPWSCDIWAPELHYVNGEWYVYSAACQPNAGNPGHRTIVLRCRGQDPMRAEDWELCGDLRGLPGDQWSIDATVFSPNEGRTWYCCYSGWPLGDHSDTQQDLFLVRLLSPTEADPKSLTCISRAELAWERPDGGKRGVEEGPTWLDMPSSQSGPGWRGIVFSGHGSWTSDYKLGLLRCLARGPDDDLCNPQLWWKRPAPLLISDKAQGGPFGPGHASFVVSPYNDGRVFCVYHGTEHEGQGWANRKARVLCLEGGAFQDHCGPVCCACSRSPMPSGPGAQVTIPQQQGNQPFAAYGGTQHKQQGQQDPGGWGGKIAGEMEKRLTGPYKGMFDRARKFF